MNKNTQTGSADAGVRVAVVGATGYAGQELVRLLARHPGATLTTATASQASSTPRRLPGLARLWDGEVVPLDPAAVAAAAALGGPAAAREVCRFALDLAPRRPRLDGRALTALGVPPGPAVGRMLDRLLTERLEGRLTSREEEAAFVRHLVTGGSLH